MKYLHENYEISPGNLWNISSKSMK